MIGGKPSCAGEETGRDGASNREGLLSVSIILEGWGDRSYHRPPFKALGDVEGSGNSGLLPPGTDICISSTERAAK